jgi:hypothetical protein
LLENAKAGRGAWCGYGEAVRRSGFTKIILDPVGG